MNQATLLFGIGAAKAGTTWLYRYLAAHPQVRLPAVKELHYFDTSETGKFDRQISRIQREKARRTGRLPTNDMRLDKRLRREIRAYDRWLNVIADPSDAAYVNFLTEAAGNARVVGDITPAYATLSQATLTRMAGLAPVTRFIFLLRDPLDRLWSNIRMAAARRSGALTETAAALLDKVLSGQDQTISARSDYSSALARVDAALDPKSLFLGFYETLFQPESVDRICSFLGLAPHPARPEARVHVGADLQMTDTQRARALAWLTPQYDAVRQRMDTLPQRWTDNMEALA
jgi:sulfotransferase family protein